MRPEPPRPSGGPVQRPRKLRTRASAYAPHVLHHVTEPVTSSACESTGSVDGGPKAPLRPGRTNRCGGVVWPSIATAVLLHPPPTGPLAASSKALQLTARLSLSLLAQSRRNWPEAEVGSSSASMAPTCALTSHASLAAVSVTPCMAAINARTAILPLERDRTWQFLRSACSPARLCRRLPRGRECADSPVRSSC